MPYNEELDNSLQEIIKDWSGLVRKKMFGGTGYLVNGNMCFGVYKDFLVLRLGEEGENKLKKESYYRQFDITGRRMKGWVMVDESGWKNPKELRRLVIMAKEFVLTLPKKN
ncbi:MAG: TfoX/Sxy family protein [Thermodesulfobacteriota bacterium]